MSDAEYYEECYYDVRDQALRLETKLKQAQQDYMALLNEMVLLRDMLQEYDPNQQRTAHYPDSMHRYAINAVTNAEKSVLYKQPKREE